MASKVVHVADADDPQLRDFLDLRDVELRVRRESEEGFFLAEGEKTIRRAMSAGYEPRAFLTAERWAPAVLDLAADVDAPVLIVDESVLEETTGFPVHRGALAALHRRPLPTLETVLTRAARVLVLEDLSDLTNVGTVFRAAAALGVDAVVLTPRCADPLYRRAVRTSMGAVFSVPWTRIPWDDGPQRLRAAGLVVAALTPDADAEDLRDVAARRHPRLALVLGSEGQGSSARWIEAADLRVRIPMRHGVDSLNVAAAAAVACYALAPPTDAGAGGR
jgi:tRNA G18 (ribose-2'-O)-methylase SpoU